jgi:hypothetical protein
MEGRRKRNNTEMHKFIKGEDIVKYKITTNKMVWTFKEMEKKNIYIYICNYL